MKRKRNSYLGGHTVLTQKRGDFERQLVIDAEKVKRRAKIAQRDADNKRAEHQRKISLMEEESTRKLENRRRERPKSPSAKLGQRELL